MITKIILKKIANYDELGVEVEGLKKINFIYGANGCGKTSMTNFLHSPQDPVFSDCSIAWQQDTILPVLVYNKSFRERNFGKTNIDGVIKSMKGSLRMPLLAS